METFKAPQPIAVVVDVSVRADIRIIAFLREQMVAFCVDHGAVVVVIEGPQWRQVAAAWQDSRPSGVVQFRCSADEVAVTG